MSACMFNVKSAVAKKSFVLLENAIELQTSGES